MGADTMRLVPMVSAEMKEEKRILKVSGWLNCNWSLKDRWGALEEDRWLQVFEGRCGSLEERKQDIAGCKTQSDGNPWEERENRVCNATWSEWHSNLIMTWNGEVPSISQQALIETNISSYLPQRAVMVPTSGCRCPTSELRIIPDLELISQYLAIRLALRYDG